MRYFFERMTSWADVQFEYDLINNVRKMCRTKGISTDGVLLLKVSGRVNGNAAIDFDNNIILKEYRGVKVKKWDFASLGNSSQIAFSDSMPQTRREYPVVVRTNNIDSFQFI